MKRILAVVVPQLACEIARMKRDATKGAKAEGDKRSKAAPLAVVLEPDSKGDLGAPVLDTAVIDVASSEARRLGVRPGQKIIEGTINAAHLEVHRVTYGELDAALGRIADIALAFGPTAAL